MLHMRVPFLPYFSSYLEEGDNEEERNYKGIFGNRKMKNMGNN